MAKVKITGPVACEPYWLGYAPGEVADLSQEKAKQVIEAGRGIPIEEQAQRAVKAEGPEQKKK